MGTASSALTMAPLVILLLAVAVSCEPDAEPYTLGQVAAGATAGGVITGVDYGHGLVSGVGAVGTGRVATVAAAVPAVPVVRTLHPVNTVPVVSTAAVTHTLPYHVYGKRNADPEPYTVGQIAAGAHIANALADGRPHNVGVITNAAVHYPAHHLRPCPALHPQCGHRKHWPGPCCGCHTRGTHPQRQCGCVHQLCGCRGALLD